ncbi:MAG: hypothetical protein ACM3XM_03230, partial [Mycobacterium leprae]
MACLAGVEAWVRLLAQAAGLLAESAGLPAGGLAGLPAGGPAFLLPLAAAMALTAGVRARWFDHRFATAIMALTVVVAVT